MKHIHGICFLHFCIALVDVYARVCNQTTEWTCPKTPSTPSKCIPIAYKCDNVPDCLPEPTDEALGCPFPETLTDFKVQVVASSLKQTIFRWSTPGDKFTNVTVNITFNDEETKGERFTLVYGSRKRCIDMKPSLCPDKYMCDIIPMTKAFCRKKCEVCRRDSVRERAYFDMYDLVKRKVTNIRARAFASNYRGDGPLTPYLEVPIPEITPVSNLTVKVTHKWVDDVWATLSWNNSKFVPKPNLHHNDGNIEHVITRCLVVERKNGSSETANCTKTRPLFPEKMQEKYYGLKYGHKYLFTVRPVYRYAEEVSGSSEAVFLNVPPKEEKFRVNILALVCGIVGAIVFLGIVIATVRKFRYRQRDSHDRYNAKYSTGLEIMGGTVDG